MKLIERSGLLFPCDLTELDVPERHLVAVILQQDVAARRLAEALDVLVFALRDQSLHLRAADFELHHFLPVEPVLDVVAADDQADLVPFADRVRGVRRGCDQIVERSGGPVAVLAHLRVGMPLVVQDLHLVPDTRVTRAAGRFRNQVLEAAVAAGCELPLERQLEVAVLAGGDDVTADSWLLALGALLDGAVDTRPPGGREGGRVVAAPPLGGLAVEQQLPSRRLFRCGEGIWRNSTGLCLREGMGSADDADGQGCCRWKKRCQNSAPGYGTRGLETHG